MPKKRNKNRQKKNKVVVRDWETGHRLTAPQIEDMPSYQEYYDEETDTIKLLEKKLHRKIL